MAKVVHEPIRRNPNKSTNILFEIFPQFYSYKQSSSSRSSESGDDESKHEANIVTQLENYNDRESDYDSHDF